MSPSSHTQVHSWPADGVDPAMVLEQLKADVLAAIPIPSKWYLVLEVTMVKDDTSTTCAFRNKAIATMDPTTITFYRV